MRTNPVKRALRDGGVAVGTFVFEFATTGIARLAAGAGAEFVVFDLEHTGWSLETLPIVPEHFGLKLLEEKGARKQFATIQRLFRSAVAPAKSERSCPGATSGSPVQVCPRPAAIPARAA